jgi:hypothetical protein
VVDEDNKLPLDVKGFSRGGNLATLTNLQFTVADTSIGTVVVDPQNDPPDVEGFFIPTGTLGTTTITATGLNKGGQQKSGTLEVTVEVGAAITVQIDALAPVPIP